MTIDHKPTEPKIPEPPLGVSREILGDPCGGDGGGGGQNKKAWKEEQRGARRIERRDEHARDAAEKSEVWRKNPRDGRWRRSGVSQPGPVISAHGGLWRPWVAHEDTEETVQTIVSIADPKNHNHPASCLLFLH